MNIKDINKKLEELIPLKENDGSEIDILHSHRSVLCSRQAIENLLKEISNQIIDDMIGEEKKMKAHKLNHKKPEILNDVYDKALTNFGYNQKVQELKEYKVKFNK